MLICVKRRELDAVTFYTVYVYAPASPSGGVRFRVLFSRALLRDLGLELKRLRKKLSRIMRPLISVKTTESKVPFMLNKYKWRACRSTVESYHHDRMK